MRRLHPHKKFGMQERKKVPSEGKNCRQTTTVRFFAKIYDRKSVTHGKDFLDNKRHKYNNRVRKLFAGKKFIKILGQFLSVLEDKLLTLYGGQEGF